MRFYTTKTCDHFPSDHFPSDHFPIKLDISFEYERITLNNKDHFNFKKADWELFKQSLNDSIFNINPSLSIEENCILLSE